jgi:hypothetical protein
MGDGARESAVRLLENVREALPRLESLLAKADDLSARDPALGRITQEMIAELRAFAPDRPLNRSFAETIEDMQGDLWAEGSAPSGRTGRPVVNAFLQARFFLHLTVHCAHEETRRLPLEGEGLPNGAAVLLRIYDKG